MAQNFHSSRIDSWTASRFQNDPASRPMVHTKILPMEEPGFFARLFRRR